ncbi:MAG: CpaF family protein, partial [Actinomycetota bacterium]|nr:CpaF family protein [Actinomycetota bacterium]
MKLSERLTRLNGHTPAVEALPNPPSPRMKPQPVEAPVDPLAQLKLRIQQALFARLGSRLYDSSLTEEQLQAFVQQELGQVVEADRTPLTAGERARLVREVSDDVLGYGPLQQFLNDATVTEVMVNGEDAIYVERDGKLHRTQAR